MRKAVGLLLLSIHLVVYAQIPAGYYDSSQGKYKWELKTALSIIIANGHTSNSYSNLWDYFERTDKASNGDVWDMYSDCNFQFITNQCGSYSGECDCFNREHSFPASWFNDGYPMYADLHHLIPTDGWANNKRSNFPFSEVGSVSYTSYNGSKLGTSVISGYSGTAFEPIDEYKGDFARMMFYMVTRYENNLAVWELNDASADAVLDGTEWPAFSTWSMNLYLQWHEEDPVSAKEVARNDSIYVIQHNRNPFIDYPEFARQIWGPDAGVVDYSLLSEVSVFPNPAEEKVLLRSTAVFNRVQILNIYGEVILDIDLTMEDEISVSGRSPGVYFVRLFNNEDPVASGKFLKID